MVRGGMGRGQSATMTRRSHDQFMPDKGNFEAVIVPNITSQETLGNTHPCITKQFSQQTGQDMGQPASLVLLNTEDKVYGADLSQKAEGIMFKEQTASCVNGLKHPGHGNHVIIEKKETPIVLDRASFNQGENALYDAKIEQTEITPPILQGDQ